MKFPLSCLAVVIGILTNTTLLGQQDRITGAIDNKRAMVLESAVRPLALAEHGDEGLVAPSLKLSWMTLWFRRTAAQEDALARLLADQQDSASPNYRKWLGSEDFANQFGLSPADFEKVAAWLEQQGFHVEYRANDRDFIAFSGTAGQVRNTFHTEIHRYTIRGESRYMNNAAPAVPEALWDVVLSLQGLTDVHLRPRVKGAKPAATLHPNTDNGDGTESLAPDDIAKIYNIAPLYGQGINGGGQRIAILGGSNINLDDIHAFRSHYNLTGADPQIVECCGNDPGETMDEAELEADLDVEWVSAVARKANVTLVYAPNALDTAEYAIDQNLAPVISESFGVCEAGAMALGLSFDTYRSLAQTANAKGITWLDATGDSGAADCDFGGPTASEGLAVEFPASIPEVTGVGGTEFNEGPGLFWGENGANGGSALGYISETAWNDTAQEGELSASGGGASAHFSKPSWQTGAGVPNDSKRDLPDVSLTASLVHDPYNVFTIDPVSGQHIQTTVGGTSVSAQVFAGIVALLNQSLTKEGKGTAGNINPELYALAQTPGVFHAVTTGDNIVACSTGTPNCDSGSYGYSAGVGYDLVTGLGSVDALGLVSCWGSRDDRVGGSAHNRRSCQSSSHTSTAVTAEPNLIFTNGWTKIAASVSSARGREGEKPTGTVTFSIGSTTLGTAALAGGVATLDADGTLLPTGVNTITAEYSGDTAFNVSSGSTSVTVNTPTSGVTLSASPNPIVAASGAGMTTLTWSAPGYSQLTITAGSATGAAITGTVGGSGSAQTGSAVRDGLQFFLVDLTSHSAIASVTVHVVAPTPTPVLSSLSPATTEVGSPGFKLQAIGSNFEPSSVVLWGGTKLPTQYQNSGSLLATVAASDLTQFATLQIQVNTNGQISAPQPFVIGDTPRLVNSLMTEAVGNNGCQLPKPTTSFSAGDPGATVWFSVAGAAIGDMIQADWYGPEGNLYNTVYWSPLPSGGSWCISNTLPIYNAPPAEMPGDWKVVIIWNGTQLLMLPFAIQPIPPGPYDGDWKGITNQGLPMKMTVSYDYVTAYSVTVDEGIYGKNTYGNTYSEGGIPIVGGSFAEPPGWAFSGTFQSSTEASGTVTIGNYDLTWTATKQ